MKRVADMVIATAALAITSPVLLLAGLLIKQEDGESIFFTQERLGLGMKPFQVLKFRTMKDNQVTRVGRWLRNAALDEFTQFWHVLKGDMSVVGPRPMTQADIERLGWSEAAYAKRWQVKPGVTGLVQVFGGIDAKTSAKLEEIYATHHSFGLDGKILLFSTAITLFGKQRVRGWLKNKRVIAGRSLEELRQD